MLTRLHVQGYKALWDITTTLEPLTVLVGPNGCGKTSVLESIALVRDFIDRTRALGTLPLDDLRSKHEGANPKLEIEISALIGEPSDEVKIQFSSDRGDAPISITPTTAAHPQLTRSSPALIFALRARSRSMSRRWLDPPICGTSSPSSMTTAVGSPPCSRL